MSASVLDREPAAFVARSFSGRRWALKPRDENAVRELMRAADLPLVLAQLLAARGVGPGEVQDVLNPTLKRLLPEPSTFKDMDKAAARAREAVENGERIAIFGDYDVDGSCSAALLHDFLAVLGIEARVYIPDRMSEGYGPSAHALLQLKEEGASLVFTVDCGASAHAALQAARDAGLDVIVLDHHVVQDPPPALAHVNPNQPDDNSGQGHLCAAGVTFLFAVALNRVLRGWYETEGIAEPDLREALDLVALATICDVVALTGVNRAFVRAGLAQLMQLKRPGFAALAQVAGNARAFHAYHCGYIFGPRINAGGRVGRCSLGVDLLTAHDPARAQEYAELLNLHNQERQAIEKVILDEAIAYAGTQDNSPFLFVAKEGWHAGVVGIVAGRLKDRFGKPSFVAGFEGGMGRGSARSVAGVDIGAVVRAAKEAGVVGKRRRPCDGGGVFALA